jgi:HPt (histidine-containing phosphotransfer) domain-containing protein
MVEPIIDKTGLMERLDGDQELLGELVELFLADCPRLLEEIRAAVESDDAEQLMRAAHTLKGSVSNFCASDAAEAAQKLESLGRAGDLAVAPEYLATLEPIMERLNAELDQLARGVPVS